MTNDKPMPKVTIYTSPTCHWCRVAKHYCDERGIEFAEVDIITDLQGRREMVAMTGQYGVPVVRVGEHAMVGWDVDEFKLLLSGEFKRR